MKRSLAFIIVGISLFFTMLLIPAPDAIGDTGWRVIAVISLMLIWWISEAVPIAITALLPIVLFPVLKVVPLNEVTANYGNHIVFLFLGGFTIALAMEKWNLHTRIALAIVRKTGTHANGIILGFMIATAFLSMWLSNTATTVMMLPIAASILALVTNGKAQSELPQSTARFALSLVLGIAFAANIGGTATLTGTPPNAIFAAFMQKQYDYTVEYGSWIMIGLPFAVLMLIACWFVLCFLVYPSRMGNIAGASSEIEKRYKALGKISYNEIMVLVVFVSTALLWIFKSSILPFAIKDAGIAIAASIILFLIPREDKKGFLMQWGGRPENNDMIKMPWNILLLFGGGLSIAGAMDKSGLVSVIGEQISSFDSLGIFGIVVLCFIVTLFITEVMSNLALITIFLPVLAGIALNFGENPLLFAIGATLASSCAFMLPMATPPNAIVFASGYIKIAQMVKVGTVMNIISIILITLLSYTLISAVFDIKAKTVPQWAKVVEK
ncbi:MAG: SLC13 family permease [Rickettsiales bacterium]|nr:SLC13 family permease [Pseudomonadota bacterium]MDA0965839.1 SLC13 family permease [Pseudomonadota bacterium]MDG4542691.1 SLC13 family permease [Rickettsiales bacterium]MDG4545195.1 SLC13 family permease [Rickettsiales bacterium]MDG4547318.1 SLC13 family permease [Rickettsiales bacterium]